MKPSYPKNGLSLEETIKQIEEVLRHIEAGTGKLELVTTDKHWTNEGYEYEYGYSGGYLLDGCSVLVTFHTKDNIVYRYEVDIDYVTHTDGYNSDTADIE